MEMIWKYKQYGNYFEARYVEAKCTYVLRD